MKPGGKKATPTSQDASDKSVVDDLANTAHDLCQMLCPLAGQRAQTVRIAFVMWRWHISNDVSQSVLVPLLELFTQVLSVAGAHKLSNVATEAFPKNIFLLRKWFGMDDAGVLKKMVCCDNCYRIYPDDARMQYTDCDGNYFA